MSLHVHTGVDVPIVHSHSSNLWYVDRGSLVYVGMCIV